YIRQMPNWSKLRDDFAVTKKYVYLANAAIAPIPVPVYKKVSEFYSEVLNHGETSWNQWVGKTEETKDLCAKFIGADTRDEIALTHSTSEGMNIVAHMLSDKGAVLSNELEFPSSNLPWLNKNMDNIKFVKARDGNKILINDISKMIDKEEESSIKNGNSNNKNDRDNNNSNNKRTKTIVTSHVQYSTGFRQDLVGLHKLTKRNGLYFAVNSTQSLGALYFNVKDFGIDFMVSNGHKWMLSSFGIGILYIKKKYLRDPENFKPPFFSQSGQKRRENFNNNMKLDTSGTAARFEIGTPHFANIIALNTAIKYISRIGINQIERRILSITDYLIDKLQSLNLEILSPIEDKKYRSGIVVFKSNKRKKPIDIVTELQKRERIIVSARGKGIRVSPHFYNNEEDIDRLVTALKR
ncbi:MAG: aminotransferase class V-fold PLP-dependent enzyme, partial [Thermoproteota archaeon]|nr:aminotransferase class V-fold PLP-dependent enzyme [Thermoproteota archaeon]